MKKAPIETVNKKLETHISLKKIVDFFVDYGKKITSNHVFAYSAQSSFFIVISMVPFIMLLFSIFRLFIPLDKSVLVNMIETVIPKTIQDFCLSLVDELYSKVSVSVVSITTIALLWSASKGVKSIVTGLQNVYGITKPTDFIMNIVFSLLYTLIFIVVILLTVVVLIFGRWLNALIFGDLPVIQEIIDQILGFRNILFAVPLTVFFALSYKFLAKNDIPLKKHFYGAFIAALGWMVFSYFYSLYIDNFARFSYIYGSLTAIILLMLWLYICMSMFLMGAQANVVFYEKGWSLGSLARYIRKKIKSKRGKNK